MIYRTTAADGTERMALHPMSDAPPVYEGPPRQHKRAWPFRVVYRLRGYHLWRCSCRGQDTLMSRRWGRHYPGEPADGGSEFQALGWLERGEA